MPRSGWYEWRIWLKLASKQRRHLDHNERSECLSKLTSIKKVKNAKHHFERLWVRSQKGITDQREVIPLMKIQKRDHRPTGGNPFDEDPKKGSPTNGR